MEVFAGEFNSTAGSGTQAVTGVDFIPNAIIFFICAAGADDAWSGDAFWSLGFATGTGGTETVSGGGSLRDNRTSNTGFTRNWNDDAGIRVVDAGGTVLLDFTIDSFDADGFTINKATGGVFKVKFMAISCDDSFAGSQAGQGSTGEYSFTDVGFEGDLFICGGSLFRTTEPSDQTSLYYTWGAATSPTDQFSSCSEGDDPGLTNAQSRFSTDSCLVQVDVSGSVFHEQDFTSFDADGITLNQSVAHTGIFQYLVLKDIEGFAVKNDWDTAASTGNQSVGGLSREPRGLLFQGINSSTINSTLQQDEMTWGICDENINENSVAAVDEDNAVSGQVDQFIDTNSAYHGGSVGGVTERVADLVSMDALGFTVNWASVNGTVRVGVIAFGNSGPLEVVFGGELRGRNVVQPFSGAHRGRHRVINRLDQSLRGRTKTAFDTFPLSLRGRARLLNVYDQAMRGAHEVQLLLDQSLRGRNKTEGPALVLFTQSLRGVHGVQQQYDLSVKARNRIANDALKGYELHISADVEPDLTLPPTETFPTLPHTTAALIPPPSGERKYLHVLRLRNEYNLISQNISSWPAIIDAAGAEVLVLPSAPTEYDVQPAEAINANVTAEYLYTVDGVNEADTWAIFLTSNGTPPNPAVDAPFITIPMIKADGVAKLDTDLGPFIEGNLVQVVVATRRGAVQSDNTAIVQTIVTALGPVKPDADIHIGDRTDLASTEGDNND